MKLYTLEDLKERLPITKFALIKLRRSGILNPHIKASKKGRSNCDLYSQYQYELLDNMIYFRLRSADARKELKGLK